jgi:hypothetical protein
MESQIPISLSKINVVTKNNLVWIIIQGTINNNNPTIVKMVVRILATNAFPVFLRSIIPSLKLVSLLSNNFSDILINHMLSQAENKDKTTLRNPANN